MRKLFLVCASSLLLSACASVPPSADYLSALNGPNTKATLSSVIPAAHAQLLPADGLKSELKPGDEAVHLNGYSSYYKVFEMQGAGAKQFEVNAVCACFGFDKRILIPVLYFFSGQGKLISTTSAKYRITPPSGFTPMRLTLAVRVDAEIPKYILVAANNSDPDSTVERIVVRELPGAALF